MSSREIRVLTHLAACTKRKRSWPCWPCGEPMGKAACHEPSCALDEGRSRMTWRSDLEAVARGGLTGELTGRGT